MYQLNERTYQAMKQQFAIRGSKRMKRLTTHIKAIMIIAGLFFTGVEVLPVLAAAAVSNLNNLNYTEQQGWVDLDGAVSVSGDNDWSNGYVQVAISGGNSYDDLRLVSGGSLSVSGSAVFWNGNRIGTVDFINDGLDGLPLKITFSGSLPNADFETGDMTGWSVDNSWNQMTGQVWAEGPNTTLPKDYNPTVDDMDSGSCSATVTTEARDEGSYGLKLDISGHVVNGYGTGHCPSVLSSPFSASNGDNLSMRWLAAETSDYYDVFGFVENIDTGAYQKLFHETGSSTPWNSLNTTIDSTVCSSGVCNLRFRFVNGTYDQTGGKAIGSYLYIDGISVDVAAVATNSIVESIIENIQYSNASDNPPSSRSYTLSHNDGTGVGSSNGTINITAVNDPPTDISLSANHVTENQSGGAVVGTLSSTDVDSGSFTYAVLNGAPFTTSGNQLVTAGPLDHEGSGGSYSVQVQTNDGAGGTHSENFTVYVDDANDAPTDITLSNNSVNENQSAGTAVGNLTSTDQDGTDSHSYTITGGDTAYFRISPAANCKRTKF
jgi:hypothetical protein